MLEKWFACLMSALLITQVYGKETLSKHTYTLRVECKDRDVQGLQLDIYDKNDNKVTSVEVNSEGKALAELEEDIYTVRSDPAFQGILPYENTLKKEGDILQLEAIHIVVTSEIPMTYVLQEEETKETMIIDIENEEDIGRYAVYGKSYTLYQKEPAEGYAQHSPVTFTVGKEKTDIHFAYVHGYPVTLESEVLAKAIVYKDKDCKEPLVNHLGKPMCITSNESIYLPPGTYCYRYEDIDSHYYAIEDVFSLEVKDDKVTLQPDFIQVTKSILSDTLLPYTFTLTKGNGDVVEQWVNDGQTKQMVLERDTEYTLKSDAVEGGYAILPVSFFTSLYKEDSLPIEIKGLPFSVFLEVRDAFTNHCIEGVEVQMYDITQDAYATYLSSKNPLSVQGIFSQDEVSFEIPSVPAGYLPSFEKITMNIDGQSTYTVCLTLQPYVEIYVPLPEDTRDFMYGLYMDSACSSIAKDIEGNPVWFHSLNQRANVVNGTYYLKQTQKEKNYYTDTQVYTIETDSGVQPSVQVEPVLKKCLISASVKDYDTGQCMPEVKIELKEESGKVIDTWYGTQEKQIAVEPGVTYILEQVNTLDHYSYATPMRIRVEDLPSDMMYYALHVRRYFQVSMRLEEGMEYQLYHDEERKEAVKDIEGNPVIFHADNIYPLRQGQYCLFQTQSNSRYFRKNDFVSVYIDKDMEIHDVPQSAGVILEVVDDFSHQIEGTIWALYDEEHRKLLETGETGKTTISYPFVECGKTYTLQNVRMIPGMQAVQEVYTFTVPETAIEIPLITLQIRKENKVMEIAEVKERTYSGYATATGICVGIVTGIFIFFRTLKNRF